MMNDRQMPGAGGARMGLIGLVRRLRRLACHLTGAQQAWRSSAAYARRRRRLAVASVVGVALCGFATVPTAQPALADGEAAWALLRAAAAPASEPRGAAVEAEGGAAASRATVVLFRHANAPGVGDPPGLRLDDCRTQRNLDEAGREQARRIGRAFAARGVVVGGVWTSPWCRARDTAEGAFPGRAIVQPAFGSFFGARESEPRQTREALAALNTWRGPGVLVVFTHQVNISALAGGFAASGEGVVLTRELSRPGAREGAADKPGDRTSWRPVARLSP